MLHTFFWLLLMLCAGHALCDYPLQGDFLARGKNPNAPIPGIPWRQCLLAHALIHAGMVTLITGSVMLGIMELSIHMFVDRLKCNGIISFNTDQAIHYGCKLAWTIAVLVVKS